MHRQVRNRNRVVQDTIAFILDIVIVMSGGKMMAIEKSAGRIGYSSASIWMCIYREWERFRMVLRRFRSNMFTLFLMKFWTIAIEHYLLCLRTHTIPHVEVKLLVRTLSIKVLFCCIACVIVRWSSSFHFNLDHTLCLVLIEWHLQSQRNSVTCTRNSRLQLRSY